MQFCYQGIIEIIYPDLIENYEVPYLASILVDIYLIPYGYIRINQTVYQQ